MRENAYADGWIEVTLQTHDIQTKTERRSSDDLIIADTSQSFMRYTKFFFNRLSGQGFVRALPVELRFPESS